ncbi:Protein T24A6.20 [Aphelenchoides avenae]|nr:Protein T24A6.20 [Aphelenchus avenae]
MPPNAQETGVVDKFQFVINPDVEVWEEIVRLTTKHEGWAMSVCDYRTWLDAFGPGNLCLLVAIDKDSKEFVGSVCSATYPSSDGSKRITTVGMFFLRPEYRGIGLGMELFDRLLQSPNVVDDNKALMGVPVMSPKYAKIFGFNKFADDQVNVVVAKVGDLRPSNLEIPAGIELVGPTEAGWSKVFEYDAKYTAGVIRQSYLKALMTRPAAYAKVAVDESGDVVGFGVIRQVYNKRLSVGPLYADNDVIAGAILRSILEAIDNLNDFDQLLMFPPSSTKGAFDIMAALSNGKAENVFTLYCQFTKEILQVPVENIYCITEYAMSFV